MNNNYNYKDEAKAKVKKEQRLYNRILKMLQNNKDIVFITLTFSDETLNTTNEQTRERYIKEFLNEQTSEYILNRDYGKTNKREHYHAIAKPKYKGFIYGDNYKYGKRPKIEKINKQRRYLKNKDTIEIIAQRLKDHALKNSTKESRIIYSKMNKKTASLNPYEKEIDAKINQIKTFIKQKYDDLKELESFERQMEQIELELYEMNKQRLNSRN